MEVSGQLHASPFLSANKYVWWNGTNTVVAFIETSIHTRTEQN